jgi:hypothetical protein
MLKKKNAAISCKSSPSTLDLQVAINTENITTNTENITTNTENITTNTGNITALQNSVTGNITALQNSVSYIGTLYSVPIYNWRTQDSGPITIPQKTGMWFQGFVNQNIGLPQPGVYMVNINYTTFINTAGHTDRPTITVGCELFQNNVGLSTFFQSSCTTTVNRPISGTGNSLDGYYGAGVSMSFPLIISNITDTISMSLYYFFSNDYDMDIQIRDGCPDSGDPLEWWRDSINTGGSGFYMTLLSA